jgi:ATP-dependent Clp protease ATP-binding subunit ClpA
MRYSRRVQSVIRLANQEAVRLNHDHISTGHLLLGLIREGEGAALTFLEDMGVDLEKIKAELEHIMENKGRGPVIGKLQLTSRANDALRVAAEESENMGHKYLGTEHLLLGIISEQEGVASKTLAKFGVSLENARSAARAIAVDEEEPSETLTFHDVKLYMPTQKYNSHYPSPEGDILNLEQASQLLDITVDELNDLMRTENLPARMIGGKWRFSRSAIIKWLGEGKSGDYMRDNQ